MGDSVPFYYESAYFMSILTNALTNCFYLPPVGLESASLPVEPILLLTGQGMWLPRLCWTPWGDGPMGQ
jgi:hypothetical protein